MPLLIFTIFLSATGLWIILPIQGFVPHSTYDINDTIIGCYIISIIALLIGYKWTIVYKWIGRHTNILNQLDYNDLVWEIYKYHLSRMVNFLMVIVIGFTLGLAGASWYAVTPLLIASGIALILTYPSNKKIERWKHKEELNK